MFETILVFLIVAVAAAYIGRVYYRKFKAAQKAENPCSCSGSCEGCQVDSADCNDIQQKTG